MSDDRIAPLITKNIITAVSYLDDSNSDIFLSDKLKLFFALGRHGTIRLKAVRYKLFIHVYIHGNIRNVYVVE